MIGLTKDKVWTIKPNGIDELGELKFKISTK